MAKSKKNKPETEEFEVVEVSNESSFSDFFSNKQYTYLGIAGVAILLIGAYLAYSLLYLAPKEKTAVQQMFKAEFQFQQDSFALALEAPGGGYEGFLDIIDNYSGTKAANLAKYYAGVCYLNLGRYEDAVQFLKAHNEKGNITVVTKYGALGDAYSELNELDKAMSSYEKATNSDINVLTPYYLYKLGLLANQQNDKEKALKAFSRIEKEFPNSVEATEASKYIGLLN